MYKIENHKVTDAARSRTHVDEAGYEKLYRQSIEQPDAFWSDQAKRFPFPDKKIKSVNSSHIPDSSS